MNIFRNPQYYSLIVILGVIVVGISALVLITGGRGFSLTAGPIICPGVPTVVVKRPTADTVIRAGIPFSVRWGSCRTAGGAFNVNLVRADSGTVILSVIAPEEFDAGIDINLDPATTPGGNYYFTVTSSDGVVGRGPTFVVNSTYVSAPVRVFAVLYTDEGYERHEEAGKPNKAEYNMEYDLDYRTNGSKEEMLENLDYIYDVMTGRRPEDRIAFPYTWFTIENGKIVSGFLYTYPEPEVQTAELESFKTWWLDVVYSWAAGKGLDLRHEKLNAEDYIEKITFDLQ